MVVEISEAGLYVPLVRYEAPFNFESMFRLSIAQAGKEVYAAAMGGRSQGKVNGFSFCQPNNKFGPHSLGPECRFGWGTTEAMVSIRRMPSCPIALIISPPPPAHACPNHLPPTRTHVPAP